MIIYMYSTISYFSSKGREILIADKTQTVQDNPELKYLKIEKLKP